MADTPMMKQYHEIKSKHQDAILFFRLGDFYEMFFDDAIVASKALDLTLTSRNKNQQNQVPLCGVPFHSAQGYINRLLEQGHKVAICEQTEDPKFAKGIVKREVVQIFSPGLVLDPECLEKDSHNFLACVAFFKEGYGIALVDISTGIFKLTEVFDEIKLIDEIFKSETKELLIHPDLKDHSIIEKLKLENSTIRINPLAGWYFDADFNQTILEDYYQTNINNLGLKNHPQAKLAGGALLAYLKESNLLKANIISKPSIYLNFEAMILDENTRRNLELTSTLHDHHKKGSVFWLIDQSKTTLGSRCLKDWLLAPLIDPDKINLRLDSVEEFFNHSSWMDDLRLELDQFSDIERIQNRIVAGLANPRDIIALKNSIQAITPIKDLLKNSHSPLLKKAYQALDPLDDIFQDIEIHLVDEPPLTLKEGGLIKKGVLDELDELKEIETNGKSTIARMEALEREKTGINSLKIRFNKVFGYYIEITNVHKNKAPLHYIRKQTLSNAERYITDELKKYEDKVLGASEKIKNIEYILFTELRERLALESIRIKENAKWIAIVDALASLAYLALHHHYVRPQISPEPVLKIKNARHPLIEVLFETESFVPNDIELGEDCQLMLITGPNMAGKSTVMRQVALINLLAQMGSFVPCQEAMIGITDRIFTRIGASDYLQKGQSTFMVEMLETASILAEASNKSLILLDEIGRGTSTFDGLSIAWAVCENIHDKIQARTMFATHYHELTDLAVEKEGIKNFHIAVSEHQGEIKFLRVLKEGGTNRSYGVLVAKMAGLPHETIQRAKEILKLLEKKDLQFQSEANEKINQPSLFEYSPPADHLREKIKELDINQITPLQALEFINRLKEEI